MKKTLASLAAAVALSFTVGCDQNNNTGKDMAQSNPDMSPTCVTNPTTHVELLNACTTAQSVDKQPFYPALAPNGVLPAP